MTRKGKARENRTKEGLRTGVRTSGSTNSTPGWPSLHRAGPGEEKTHKKRSQRPRVSLSHVRVSLSLSLFTSFGSACPHASRMYFPLFSK